MSSTSTLRFNATREKGQVSALYLEVAQPRAFFVLAHGAGANMQHAHMARLADTLADQQVSSLRFNFPYMEKGGNRTDSKDVCVETIDNAIVLAKERNSGIPLILAGHSFGGRMSSHYVAEKHTASVDGLVYFSFPLHPAKKPATKRADHLPGINIPQFFVSGTRDSLAELKLLEPMVANLARAELHLLETADHSFKILKRTRTSPEDVYDEVGRVIASWLDALQ